MVIALDAVSTCWYTARQLPDVSTFRTFFTTVSFPICRGLSKRERYSSPACSGGRASGVNTAVYVSSSLISQLKSLGSIYFIFL